MGKHKSVVPLNVAAEAFALYSELMPSVTDVRGEKVLFDLGTFAHLLRDEERLERIGWIGETLRNPEEIRRDFDKRFPYREIYVNTVYEDSADQYGEPFVVVIDRRLDLNFWTAFVPDERHLRRVRRGRLLWVSGDS